MLTPMLDTWFLRSTIQWFRNWLQLLKHAKKLLRKCNARLTSISLKALKQRFLSTKNLWKTRSSVQEISRRSFWKIGRCNYQRSWMTQRCCDDNLQLMTTSLMTASRTVITWNVSSFEEGHHNVLCHPRSGHHNVLGHPSKKVITTCCVNLSNAKVSTPQQ